MSTVGFPVRITGATGLSFELNANGSVRRIDHADIMLNMFLGTEIEGGPVNIHLRRLGKPIESIAMLGPQSRSELSIDAKGLQAQGEWDGIEYRVRLRLAANAAAWFWHLELRNVGTDPLLLDLVHLQDVGIAHYGAIRNNEYYISQYVDHTPFSHPRHGAAVASRQNLPMGGRHPWLLLGSLGKAASYATDGLQFYGLAARAGSRPAGLVAEILPGKRLQHEHSMVALQEAPFRLGQGERATKGFFGRFEPHHPAASSLADLALLDETLALAEARAPLAETASAVLSAPAASLFVTSAPLATSDLSEKEIDDLFGHQRRQEEVDCGKLVSFFVGANRHVVLRAKELAVIRSHAHILRTGALLVPEEAALCSTVCIGGVFNSLLTQGHVGINRLLSATHGYLGFFRADGQRVFVEIDGGYRLLELPSAFEMAPGGCRWIYKFHGGLIEVSTRAPVHRHAMELRIEVRAGAPRRFLLSHHVALGDDDGSGPGPVAFTYEEGAVCIRPDADSEVGRRFPAGYFRIEPTERVAIEKVGGDELLFVDGKSRCQPFLALQTAPTRSAGFSITGHLVPAGDDAEVPQSTTADDPRITPRDDAFWLQMIGNLVLRPVATSPLAARLLGLGEILPWFAHNALIHYLAPRGLEQYTGGGWGTRDISQGPVELLLAIGRHAEVRDILLRLFAAQNADGDWPQWFTFFERDRHIRAPDSHGDIVFWPLFALAQYLIACKDGSILEAPVPFFEATDGTHEDPPSVRVHVDSALAVMRKRVIAGTRLTAYGHGDWNDSLQPADAAMTDHLCSTWTVTLHVHTLTMLAKALRGVGEDESATTLENEAAEIATDFRRFLFADGVLAGFAHFHGDGSVRHLLHPRDTETGISYRLLPMIHALMYGLFEPGEAEAHVGYIKRHLLGPDGARLFDKPPSYRGGPQSHFQRAESSPFFGREIGVMYMHAHLRYAQAMASYGDGEALFLALAQANPIAICQTVATARPRQANCYYTSSDAAFPDRYEASARYAEIRAGKVALEGGWRVYSSGAGIAVRLVHQCLLGLRQEGEHLVIDPVLPVDLDGLEAELDCAGLRLTVLYRIGRKGCGPVAVRLNNETLAFTREHNRYRCGGVRVALADLRAAAGNAPVRLEVELQ